MTVGQKSAVKINMCSATVASRKMFAEQTGCRKHLGDFFQTKSIMNTWDTWFLIFTQQTTETYHY